MLKEQIEISNCVYQTHFRKVRSTRQKEFSTGQDTPGQHINRRSTPQAFISLLGSHGTRSLGERWKPEGPIRSSTSQSCLRRSGSQVRRSHKTRAPRRESNPATCARCYSDSTHQATARSLDVHVMTGSDLTSGPTYVERESSLMHAVK